MAPLMPVLQQYGIPPAQWITNMGQAHHSLVFGTPQQKLQMFSKLAQDYGVPLQALYDPQVQQQFLMQQTLQPQPQAQQPNVDELVERKFVEISAKQDLQQFQNATDKDGSPLYPHYEELRDTMAQLLESGVAKDLPDAYGKAERLDENIWEAKQAAKQASAQRATQEAQAKAVAKAKAAAASRPSATPSAEATPQSAKGIRATLEAAVEAHAGSGRV
jgi:hypothetical protein